MIKRIKTTILVISLVLTHLMFSYLYFGGWWNSSAGTLLIVLLSYFIWGRDFLQRIGLKLKVKTIVFSILIAGLVFSGAYFIMAHIAAGINAYIYFSNWRDYYHDVFYILNEEIVVGSLVLFAMVKSRKLQPIWASVILAVCFSLIHFVFYKWIFNCRGILGGSTLLTLFFVGLIRNNLILQTGHIAYSWALHFGWMAVMFGSSHRIAETGEYLSEPQRFNLYLGSWEMLVISAILAGLSVICLKKLKV